MTRKNYERIARALYETKPETPIDTLDDTEAGAQWARDVDAITRALAQDNPRFQACTFKRACGRG